MPGESTYGLTGASVKAPEDASNSFIPALSVMLVLNVLVVVLCLESLRLSQLKKVISQSTNYFNS